MGKSRRKFRPGIYPTIAFLIVLPGLIALGFWQLDRADQKRRLQNMYDQRHQSPPIRLGANPGGAKDLLYYRVLATGKFDAPHQFLVDNRVLDGRVGFHVVTPLVIANSETRILVNRGWVQGNPDRTILPEVKVPRGQVTIKGVAVVPHINVFQLKEPEAISGNWPVIWQHIDLQRYRQGTGQHIYPIVVLQDPDTNQDELERKWKRLDTGIAVHQSYAFQWFSLALALTAIFIFVNYRPVDGKASDDE